MDTRLEQIIAAHGGVEYWRSLSRIELALSAGGFLFTAKGLPPLAQAHLGIRTDAPEAVLHDYPEPGRSAHFLGEERVEIRDAAGRVLSFRDQPRQSFASLRRFFRWDALDFTYFCGYAMWNYLCMPYLLLAPGVELEVSDSPIVPGGTRIKARFPAGFPTHCREQVFHFGPDHRLVRHDYTAEVVGAWAKAAHLCAEYRSFGGLSLPTRRRVYPTLYPFTSAIRALTLVALDVHAVEVFPRQLPR